MTINYKYIIFLLLSAILFQCVPPEEVVLTEVTRDLRDSTLQAIIRYQDEQKTTELFKFYNDKDPS